MAEGFEDRDSFRNLAAAVSMEKLRSLLDRHGLEVDDEIQLVNQPSPEALVAFYENCLEEHGILADSEVFTRKNAGSNTRK